MNNCRGGSQEVGVGTTPSIKFKLHDGATLSDYSVIRLTVTQFGTVIAVKEKEDAVDLGDGVYGFYLAQEETLKLCHTGVVEAQMRWKSDAFTNTTKVKEFPVRRLLGEQEVV